MEEPNKDVLLEILTSQRNDLMNQVTMLQMQLIQIQRSSKKEDTSTPEVK